MFDDECDVEITAFSLGGESSDKITKSLHPIITEYVGKYNA